MPRYGREAQLDCKIYVGDLPRDASEKELERAFSYYGPLKSVWVARNPPGFAFVEFDDPRDAEDAVRGLDGTSMCGSRIRCEHSTGKSGQKPWMSSGRRGPPRLRKPYDPNDRCYECGGRGHYAYDCTRYGSGGGGGGGGGRGRKRSRSRSRSRSPYDKRRDDSPSFSGGAGKGRHRSRSRSRDRCARSRSRSRGRYRTRSRSGSRSPARRGGGADRFRTKSRSPGSRSISRGRSRSPGRKSDRGDDN